MKTLVVGVDPGLVHTGVVALMFEPIACRIHVAFEVVDGPNAREVDVWVNHWQQYYDVPQRDTHVFIEGYKPRSHFNSDARMVKAVSDMGTTLKGSKVLLNTGVKQVIRQPLMDLLEVWDFPVTTHHQDLRAAARIALLGMVKNVDLNILLAQFVHDHVKGETWNVLR